MSNLVQNQSRICAAISELLFGRGLVDQIGCVYRNYSQKEAIGIIEDTSLFEVTIELLSFEQLR